MSPELLKTKLIPPYPRADFVSRPRLVHRIANPKRGRVTLITAPAGYGKTTLLAEWCRLEKAQIAWLALDAADNDPALFWRGVAAAFGVAGSPGAMPGVSTLVNELVPMRAPATLVLDDLHIIHSKPILSDLTHFIEHAPHRLQFVLASRTEPKLPLALWRARGELTELRARHLAFTLGEARAFLQTTMQLDLGDELVADLEKTTEGWAAGLQLAALAASSRELSASVDIPRAHIFEYLASQVLEQQPRTRKRFLLETSVLDRVNAGLANAVTGRKDGDRQLGKLTHANLFVTGLDAQDNWFRFHPLFSEFLQKKLEQLNPELVGILHQRAAHWFAQNGLYPEAIDHAMSARDFHSASAWIDHACEMAMQRGQLETMLKWLDALPPDVVSTKPSLSLWYGWVLCLKHHFDEMETHLVNAEHHAARMARERSCWKPELDIVRGKLAAVRAQAAILQNNDAETLKWCDLTLKRLPERFRRERSTALLNRALALARCGQTADANEAFKQAERLGRRADHPFIHFSTLYEHALFLAAHDEPGRAQGLLRKALTLAEQEDVPELEQSAQELLNKILTVQRFEQESLSAREREILQWLARGESNPQIAKRIGIGVGTVNWHTKNIYRKLGVKNRTEAAVAHRGAI